MTEEINYLGPDDLIFNNDTTKGIHSGGFSVKSAMLKAGMSPIMTINDDYIVGGGNNVSDIFNNLVIPYDLGYNTQFGLCFMKNYF